MKEEIRELTAQEIALTLTREERESLVFNEPFEGIIGQDRALKALKMGAEIRAKGYNIFVTGVPGTGRNTAIRKVLDSYKDKPISLKDIAFVYNFKLAETPMVLYFPPGKAREFKKDLHKTIENLKTILKDKLESESYRNQRDLLVREIEAEENKLLSNFDSLLMEQGFQIKYVQEGDSQATDIVPIYQGEQTDFDHLQNLVKTGEIEESYWQQKREQYYRYMDEMKRLFGNLRSSRNKTEEKLSDLREELARPVILAEIEIMKNRYPQEKVETFLRDMAEDILENLYLFTLEQAITDELGNPALIRYGVNVLLDNFDCRGIPVIQETQPNYKNLFGTIESRIDPGNEARTSFMMIRPGAIIRSDNGFLILQAEDLFKEEDLWFHLKGFLKSGRVEIQPEQGPFGSHGPLLKPEPVEVATKLILVGNEHSYDILYNQDPDFQRFFKIPAEFDSVMPRTPDTVKQYVSFVKGMVRENELHEVSPEGLESILMYGIRLSEQKNKLSTRFSQIQDLLIEADYWSLRLGKEKIEPETIERALEERNKLFNLPEEKILEMIHQGEVLIQVSGLAIGQVNGLAVQDRGYYSFGSPCLITARTAPGDEGIINIEREVGLSGEIHDKGVFILEGFLRSRYAQTFPLSIYASICFEQSYSEIDGDSASSSEVYALLSSISQVPLKQGIAVTGSVNQSGEIQPVGGITEKVEGFYRICRELNYTGSQGVIIPEQNIKNLILSREILKEIQEGRFHLYPIRTIDEGTAILSGLPSGERNKKGVFPPESFNHHVEKRLKEMALMMKEYGNS